MNDSSSCLSSDNLVLKSGERPRPDRTSDVSSEERGLACPRVGTLILGRRGRRHDQEERLLFVLPQELSRRRAVGRRTRRRLHLRRVHRALPVDSRAGTPPPRHQQATVHADSHAARNRHPARRIRDRAGARQEGAGRRRPQPLQAADAGRRRLRRRDRQVEHPAARARPAAARRCWPARWPRFSTCRSRSATPRR